MASNQNAGVEMPTPAYLKAFKTFLASGAGLEDRSEIEQELYADDRGNVILGAANVEDMLQLLIEQKMRRPLSNDLRERLFEGTGPLSSFSARINIGYALGLFGPKFRHDLDLIRELRNGFAHVRHPMTLSTPQVAEVVKHADSDEIARAFRDDVARGYEMMSPGLGASLACVFLALDRCRSSVPDCVSVASISAGRNDGGQFVEVEFDDRL